MANYTPPLDKEYPNWEAVIEDSIPILCTILLGFCAAYFAAIAALKPEEHALGAHVVQLSSQHWPHIELAWQIDVRDALLVSVGLNAVCFYLSTMAAVYAKMFNTERFAQKSTDQAQIKADEEAQKEFRVKWKRSLRFSMVFFNIGAFLLPLSGFILLPTPFCAIATLSFVTFCVWIARGVIWRGVRRLFDTKRVGTEQGDVSSDQI